MKYLFKTPTILASTIITTIANIGADNASKNAKLSLIYFLHFGIKITDSK